MALRKDMEDLLVRVSVLEKLVDKAISLAQEAWVHAKVATMTVPPIPQHLQMNDFQLRRPDVDELAPETEAAPQRLSPFTVFGPLGNANIKPKGASIGSSEETPLLRDEENIDIDEV